MNPVLARAVRIAIATLGATAATVSVAQNTGNELVLAEVTVTAQRTSASLQDVPISVTALSAEDIDRQQINNTLDVISKVPNLVGSNNVGLGSATSFFLRGVGQDESLATSDPAIGTYVDGVYIARQINNNAFLYDMDRIEVLRLGAVQGVRETKSTTREEIVGLITGILKEPVANQRPA